MCILCVCVCVCVCVCIHPSIYTYIHRHTHTHIHKGVLPRHVFGFGCHLQVICLALAASSRDAWPAWGTYSQKFFCSRESFLWIYPLWGLPSGKSLKKAQIAARDCPGEPESGRERARCWRFRALPGPLGLPARVFVEFNRPGASQAGNATSRDAWKNSGTYSQKQ